MKIDRNRAMAVLIALFLMAAIAISLVALPVATAQNVGRRKTYAFIGATPNPVGVGQPTLLHVGITSQLSAVQDSWEGLTVTVTRPDGKTETLGPIRTDATGGTGTQYVPAMEGNYTLQTHFPGQWLNRTGYNIYYEASDSDKLTLIVQQEPIEYYPGVPLPTEYWTRPIDAQARGWSVIGGNWLGIGQFADMLAGAVAPNNDYAPETAHVLWTKPLEEGGLTGDFLGDKSYFCGDAYEGKFSGAVIINGKIYYNKFNTIGGTNVDNYVVAVDLHTGEELWSKPLMTPDGFRRTLSFGQTMLFSSFNVQGVFAYLWGTSASRWDAFDPTDGRWLFTMTDVPGGSTLIGPRGELIRYQVNQAAGYMTMWNSSAVIDCYWGTNPNSPMWGSWRPQGKTINATGRVSVTPATPLGFNGYQWNKTIPKGLPGSVNYYVAEDVILGFDRGGAVIRDIAWGDPPFTVWAISVKPGEEGRLMFNKTYAAPAGNTTISIGRVSPEDRVFTIWCKEHRTHYGYDLDSGKQLWGPTEPEVYLSYLETWSIIYDSKLYTHGTKGIVDCYDVKTGKKLWSYEPYDPYTEILWSNNWIIRVDFIANGKIYLRHSAHSDNNPLPRGAPFICLNATTGEVIWRVNGLVRGTDWGGRGYIGDSIIAKLDTYDLLIFALGKGPSATTVTASPKISVHGSSVLVEGMVTDISPGTKDAALAMRFPNGVPAVSDESMSDWMLYVYKQFPRPANATGVEVTLDTVDPNGNWIHIGTVTSDSSGMFKKMFVPEVPGEYTIIATFPGSGAYYASYAETAIGVEEAPPATPPPEYPVPADYTLTVIGTGIAIIIAVAIVGILIVRILKKRP